MQIKGDNWLLGSGKKCHKLSKALPTDFNCENASNWGSWFLP